MLFSIEIKEHFTIGAFRHIIRIEETVYCYLALMYAIEKRHAS